jgi:hypothetical protein
MEETKIHDRLFAAPSREVVDLAEPVESGSAITGALGRGRFLPGWHVVDLFQTGRE